MPRQLYLQAPQSGGAVALCAVDLAVLDRYLSDKHSDRGESEATPPDCAN